MPEAPAGEAAIGLQMEVEAGPVDPARRLRAVAEVHAQVGLVGRLVLAEAGVPVEAEQGAAHRARVGAEVPADGGQGAFEGTDELQHGIPGFGFIPGLVLLEPFPVVVRLQVLQEPEASRSQRVFESGGVRLRCHIASRVRSSRVGLPAR